ncbi:MAG: UDP-N-acetylmuramate dehydrogenase [Tannerellaceae bacterium]|jgi:UDP-N-acetylmuramate dehydrogenase|nr:UDP-N-acetylmuramate dehydrogenase [Tannerellaceae bacterium]
MIIKNDYPLIRHNTFRLVSEARLYVEYVDELELNFIIQEHLIRQSEKNFFHLGRGSNVILADERYDGLVLRSAIREISIEKETEDDVYLRIGAGASWDDFVFYAASHKWYGTENLSGIPGEAGGCVFQNIGAYGAEIKDVVEWVEVLDIETLAVRRLTRAECLFDYRYSIFQEKINRWIILRLCVRLNKKRYERPVYEELKEFINPKSPPGKIRRSILKLRYQKIPSHKQGGNAGSFFKNPLLTQGEWQKLQEIEPNIPHFIDDKGRVKVPAARLIELCGLKGASNGKVAVSEMHALVLVNLGKAKAQDVTDMANRVWNTVYDRFGIHLYSEVKYISTDENNFPWNRNVDRRT